MYLYKKTLNHIVNVGENIFFIDAIKDKFGNLANLNNIQLSGKLYLSQNKSIDIEIEHLKEDTAGFIRYRFNLDDIKPKDYKYSIFAVGQDFEIVVIDGILTVDGPVKLSEIDIVDYSV